MFKVKVLLFFLIFMCSCFVLNAYSGHKIVFFTPEKPDFYLEQQFEYNLMKDMRSESSGFSTFGKVDAKQLKGFMGFSANSFRTDATAEAQYTPNFSDIFRLGPVVTYHYYKYAEDFVEYDFLSGVCAEFNLPTGWNFYASYQYLKKYAIIDAGTEKIKENNHSMALNSRVEFIPSQNWKFFMDLSSNDSFDYPLFYAVFLDGGFYRRLTDNIYFDATLLVKWADVVSMADGPSLIGTKFGWVIKF